MEFKRQKYLDRLVSHKGNKRVKIVTGIRRCGKSYLLFELFRRHLTEQGVDEKHIIGIQLEDRANKELRNPDRCLEYVRSRIEDQAQYYLLIDEVQMMDEFEDVLNSCLLIKNLDTYVTGSNSRFLSKDVITEFRGRGDEIYVRPLSFAEFCEARTTDSFQRQWNEYTMYGGLPYCVLIESHEEKADYLKRLFAEVYLKDIQERNDIRSDVSMEQLVSVIASGVGSLTNLRRLENTFKSESGTSISATTLGRYVEMLEDAFILQRSHRYDVKGRKYISTQQKYYFTDVGLRNAWLNFRQYEEPHLMENIIFNELCARGYSVDVGVVEMAERQGNGTYQRKQTEIDFVCNKGSERMYIQSAFALSSMEKEEQEKRSLRKVDDSFRKIVVVKEDILPRRDEAGIATISLQSFLMDEESIRL